MTPNQTPATRASAPPPKRNGNEPPPVEQPTLPEHRQKAVETGLATYQAVLAERDDLARRLHEANLKNEAMTVQLDALKGVVNMMESTYLTTKLEMENRISTYQAERDDAISRTSSLEATLANCYVIIRNTITVPEMEADSVGNPT